MLYAVASASRTTIKIHQISAKRKYMKPRTAPAVPEKLRDVFSCPRHSTHFVCLTSKQSNPRRAGPNFSGKQRIRNQEVCNVRVKQVIMPWLTVEASSGLEWPTSGSRPSRVRQEGAAELLPMVGVMPENRRSTMNRQLASVLYRCT